MWIGEPIELYKQNDCASQEPSPLATMSYRTLKNSIDKIINLCYFYYITICEDSQIHKWVVTTYE